MELTCGIIALSFYAYTFDFGTILHCGGLQTAYYVTMSVFDRSDPFFFCRSYTSSVSMTDSSWQNGHKVMVGDDDPISEHSKDQHQTYISASLNNTEGVACGNAEIPLVVGGRRFLVNPE